MLRVLVVDDSQTFVTNIVESLRRWGWEAEAALDGREAIEILSSETHFDGVLLDRSMPGISGDDVLRWIRIDAMKDPRLRLSLQHLCVVMLTGYGEVQSAIEALKLGAFQYLQKPIEDAAHLRSILAAGIAWHRAHAMRRELLGTSSREQLFEKVRSILVDSVRPEEIHIMFVSDDGSIEQIAGKTTYPESHGTPRFVRRLMTGEQLVFEQRNADVQPLEPFLADAKTIMAVPVPGSQRNMVGVLDMESTAEHAFDPSWSEVLAYLADLIGIALEIETQTSERIRLEAEKTKQLGLVYREVRHQIATEAQIVSMQAGELLEGDLSSPANEREARMRQRLTLIKTHANVVAGVVQNIKAISLEPPKPNFEKIDIEMIVRQSMEACRPQLLSGIDLTLVGSTAALKIRADRTNLTYCLKCLIQNAIEAIDDARRTAEEPDARTNDRIELRISEDTGVVRIVVLDSGVGFEVPGYVLFQPLFSTKTRRPMTGPTNDITGADRVARILELVDEWGRYHLDTERLDSMRKGVDILIRDGESVDVYIRQGPAGDDAPLSEFMRTSAERISTHYPLSGDWLESGVGLYSVRRIVEEMHGGKITAESEGFGKGARFTITLPKQS